MRRLLASVAIAAACVAALTGCSVFTWILHASNDRSGEASDYMEWLAQQPGVESVRLSYESADPGMRTDAIVGDITVAPGTDVPSLVESARARYMADLPDARALRLGIDTGLPFGLTLSLDKYGPTTELTQGALDLAESLVPFGDAVDVSLGVTHSGPRIDIDVRLSSDDPATLFTTAESVLPLLDGPVYTDAHVAAGHADGTLADLSSGTPSTSLVDVHNDQLGAACLPDMAAATLDFVAAVPDARLHMQAYAYCSGSISVPVPDEFQTGVRVEEVRPFAQAWFEAMSPLSGGSENSVMVGTKSITPE